MTFLDRAKELCESRGGGTGLPVPNKCYGLCGRKATLNLNVSRAQELHESRGGRPGFNKRYVLYGRKATLNLNVSRAQAQELCESRRCRPGLPVPNKRYGPCGRKQH